MNKEKFLKRYINDINESNRKTWKQYGKEYGVDGEDLRSLWRVFKDKYLLQGKYTHDVVMTAEEITDANLAISKISPAAENTNHHKKLSALKVDGTIMNIDEYCEHYGIPREDLKSYKLVTHNGTGAYYNITSKDISGGDVDNTILEAFDNIVSKYTHGQQRTFYPQPISAEPKALKVTISDAHLGLEPNPNGGGLFQYEYNADIYRSSIDKVYQSILKEFNTHGVFDLLLLDDLGDREDGWNGYTTRGGHQLPQNMTNSEVFDVLVDTNVKLIESLVEAKVANKIILRNVSNSNHSGDFAHIVNKAIQKIVNRLYSTEIVEVDILKKFIEYRVYGDHCFLLSHGKDTTNQKFGMPLKLDHKTINFINEYIEHYDINSKYIHFEKGDLHQVGYERTKKFDYRNYMSFAPPSCWQQHNFGDSYSGFSTQVVPKFTNEISHCDYFLEYKKVK